MNVKIKKLSDKAQIPTYAKPGDAGMDVYATRKWIDEYGNVCYGTDLAFELPEGYAMFIFPRSSVSKYTLSLCNSVGILDSGYRGELIFKFRPTLVYGAIENIEDNEDEIGFVTDDIDDNTVCVIPGDNPYINSGVLYYDYLHYNVGDKVGQIVIMPYPQIQFEEVNELEESERGTGGFGSSGK